MATVPGFSPQFQGLHFLNSWSLPNQILVLTQKFGNVNLSSVTLGFCGGMSFAVRDYFESNLMTPRTSVTPTSDNPLYWYMLQRLIDSFSPLNITAQYYWLMDPALPDHETEASKLGLAPHGRAWVMIVDQWPLIKADIDAGRLCPIGLVLIKSLSPTDLSHNHVVLVYGYDLNGTMLTMHIYDPDDPNNNNASISLDISNPYQTTQVNYTTPFPPPLQLNCFFHLDYSHVNPPQNAAFVAQTPPPSTASPNQSYPVSVTMQNTGVTTWITTGNNPYRLGSQNPQDNVTWGLNRCDVPAIIDPGASSVFTFNAKAPGAPGNYQFQWQMVQELVTWFGATTPDVQVNIPKTIKEGKEHKDKEKEGKAEKDGKDRKDRDAPVGSGPAGQPQDVEEGNPGTGQSFITPDERPAVGGQALAQADEA